ncbi:MAG TPA: hypothetical protein PKA48_18500, partial [Candidatus Obscuribacter sp.]|nr:hypothetical protein [Candidatus Obscuribacter sp.]
MSFKTRATSFWGSIKRALVFTRILIGGAIKISFILALLYVLLVPAIQPALSLVWAHLPAAISTTTALTFAYLTLRRKRYLLSPLI